MSQFDAANKNFLKAVAFVNQTNSHLFLTGKAGTGKTTFLKYIRENCIKKAAIVAPTGVAAINAGGVTIHSFFQLPMGAYLPTGQGSWDTFEGKIFNQNSLFKNLRLNAAKRELLRELDLLIIDEVSMVRADTLDAIDAVLRHVRRQPMQPFGGVQVVYIGDLFQLPPVVRPEEWRLLQQYYKSPFFFDALVLAQAQPVYIELKKIYRQSDEAFIHILNNIRNNCCTPADLEHLHRYYNPAFIPPQDEHYITLTSHNDKADTINRAALNKLPGQLHIFRAVISGEFNERSFPAEEELQLKVGSQIMFIKNDKGENRRYYNGKIGIIHSIDEDQQIMISFPGEPDMLTLEQEKWQNIRYVFNKEKDTFEEEELGTFTQYPVRLAWAITIHKSQGLTFSKAIIDAGASFAAGQVYVALSRLTGLEGLVLRSRIHPESIRTDERVLNFVQEELPDHRLQETLELEQQSFIKSTLLKKFYWNKISDSVEQHFEGYDERKLFNKNACMTWGGQLVRTANSQYEVAGKFIRQLENLLATGEEDGYERLHQRMEAAAAYFIKEIDEGLLGPVNQHLQEVNNWPKIKKYISELKELKQLFERQRQHMLYAVEITRAMHAGTSTEEILQLAEALQKPENAGQPEEPPTEHKKGKRQKGESQRTTLEMFRQGKGIADIAKERNLTYGTVESHLADFITTGEVDVFELIAREKFDRIFRVIEDSPTLTSWEIKQRAGDDVTWGEIRSVVNFRNRPVESTVKES
jgi:nucleoside-triphosphatase THEP1